VFSGRKVYGQLIEVEAHLGDLQKIPGLLALRMLQVVPYS
jgi:hypothetical protein